MRTLRTQIAALLAALVIAGLPGVALAADVPTSIDISPVDTPVYRMASSFQLAAHFDPLGIEGTVTFEWSSNGTDWTTIGPATYVDEPAGMAYASSAAMTDTPLGIRQIRARFTGDAGYESSVSSSVPQDVQKQPTNFTTFTVTNAAAGPIVPESGPLNLHADAYSVPDIDFQIETDTGWETLASGPTYGAGAFDLRGFDAQIDALGEGTHHLRAHYAGTEAKAEGSKDLTLQIDRVASVTSIGMVEEVQVNKPFQASGGVYGPASIAPTGTISIVDTTTSQTLYTLYTQNAGTPVWVDLTLSTLGAHSIKAMYSGDANYLPSEKTTVVSVGVNVVEASSVGVGYSTFYPVKDGYRDTVKISGRRDETASVTIKIYSPSGKLVLTKTLGSGTGAYTFSWNGRNSAGTLLASGKYKVNQTLRDSAGLSKTWTFYTSISKKKLVTKTAYVTKKGSSVTAKGDGGSGSITISTSGGYTKLKGVYPSGWVGVGYQLTLPTAVVYKSISFQVYNKGYMSAPPNDMAVQNFQACPYNSTIDWDISCFDHWDSVGSGNGAKYWDTTSAHLTRNRSGTRFRGIVSVNYGTVYVYSVRVKVVYQVLQ